MRGTWALTLGQWQRLPGSPGQSTGPSRAPSTSSPPPWVEGSLVAVERLGMGGRASANGAVAELTRRVGPRSHLLGRGRSWRGGAWAGAGSRGWAGGLGGPPSPCSRRRLEGTDDEPGRGLQNSAPGPRTPYLAGEGGLGREDCSCLSVITALGPQLGGNGPTNLESSFHLQMLPLPSAGEKVSVLFSH